MPEFGPKFDQNAPLHDDAATAFKSGDQLDLHVSNLIPLDKHRAKAETTKADTPQSPEILYPLHEVIGAYAVHSVRIRREHLDAA